MSLRRENAKMVGKLVVIAAGMFAFGYALIPIYKHICEMTGINILSLSERQVPGNGKLPARMCAAREHAGGPQSAPSRWSSMPTRAGLGISSLHSARASASRRADDGDVRVPERAEPAHGGAGHSQLRTAQAAAHFNKLECFCFNQYTLEPGEKKEWPVAFVIDPEAVERRDHHHAVVHLLRGGWENVPQRPVGLSVKGLPSEGQGS
jgi:cytochrome c oxidase assembly protein subunit 11